MRLGLACLAASWYLPLLPFIDFLHTPPLPNLQDLAHISGRRRDTLHFLYFTTGHSREAHNTTNATEMPSAISANANATKQPEASLWQVRPCPGKGRGLFATKPLPPGTLIMIDKPVGITNTWSQYLTRPEVDRALSTMTAAQRTKFHTLSDAGGTSSDKVVRIYQNNGHGYGPNRDQGCICFDMAFINHACVPNASWSYREAADVWIVNAVVDIAQDEEITVSYVHYLRYYTQAQRQEITREVWGFNCLCTTCKLGGSKSRAGHASDMRRVLLLGLRFLFEAKNGKLRLEQVDTALRGSGGNMLVTVPYSVLAELTEADRTFAWWLVAKLHEAEGFANEGLADPYGRAALSLRTRLLELSRQHKRVKNIEKWTGNMKEWYKIAMDASKVGVKTEGSPIFVPEGSAPAMRPNKVSPARNLA